MSYAHSRYDKEFFGEEGQPQGDSVWLTPREEISEPDFVINSH